MDKIKRYVNIHVPVTTCTLRCHYCYITHHRLFGGALPTFKYSPETVRKALSKERMGGICLINFCGEGETLLPPKSVDYVKALLEEGHYVMVVTNATTSKRFDEIAAFPSELLKRLFFKFSYHYMELKSKNLLDTFFNNINKMKNAGASFTLEAPPSDELIPYIDEMKETAIKNVGAANHVTVARDERVAGKLPILTNMNREDYRKTWSVFDSRLFDYKMSIFGVKRKEFCYAGDWIIFVDLDTGNMKQCYRSHYKQNIFNNPDKPIRFLPIGNNCAEEHCYNGHSFISFGVIPELKNAPTYTEMRNRVCLDRSEWLQPEMKAFMQGRLYESNQEYTQQQKFKVNCEVRLRKPFNLKRIAYGIGIG
ncbi:MAG: radical SAM protein, partial [Prevotellaceae bacterium]|nr:radical SAM protein [Prevotellaceae bacterium]